MNAANFDPSKPVKITSHGWGDTAAGGDQIGIKNGKEVLNL